MPQQHRIDRLYMDLALRVAQESSALRKKVGAVLVRGSNILSFGWNGTPSGDDNACEHFVDGQLTTKKEVLHAESNALMKLIETGGVSAKGSTLYVTMSPCEDCAKLIKQAGIVRVVFEERYRDTAGIHFLLTRGVVVEQIDADGYTVSAE